MHDFQQSMSDMRQTRVILNSRLFARENVRIDFINFMTSTRRPLRTWMVISVQSASFDRGPTTCHACLHAPVLGLPTTTLCWRAPPWRRRPGSASSRRPAPARPTVAPRRSCDFSWVSCCSPPMSLLRSSFRCTLK